MCKHSTNVHKEKERLPLIDCFDFFPKSAKNSKELPIELNKFIIGGPLFSNHPVLLSSKNIYLGVHGVVKVYVVMNDTNLW